MKFTLQNYTNSYQQHQLQSLNSNPILFTIYHFKLDILAEFKESVKSLKAEKGIIH